MDEELYHARRLMDLLEEHKLKLPRILYEEFTTLLDLACKVDGMSVHNQDEILEELHEFLA